MTPWLFGYIDFRIWDILDILIVAFLFYLLYKLLRGSIAFSIFIGVLLLFGTWWMVDLLNMSLLSAILGQFVSVGVIIVAIIFQPELRRFLLLVGNTTMQGRTTWLSRFFGKKTSSLSEIKLRQLHDIKTAIFNMSADKRGALIVLTPDKFIEAFNESGVLVDAAISSQMIEGIFTHGNPLHDGAMIIYQDKIYKASCVLPVSKNPNLSGSVGLRHKAAVGVTENHPVLAIIVSEETGRVSYAETGKLYLDVEEKKIYDLLSNFYTSITK